MELNDDGSTEDEAFLVFGSVDPWPSKDAMAELLRAGGLDVTVGRYSIRINDFDHFVIQEYGGDLGEPRLDADSDCFDDLYRQVSIVSRLLTRTNQRHRFEIYAPDNRLRAYFHYQWPQ